MNKNFFKEKRNNFLIVSVVILLSQKLLIFQRKTQNLKQLRCFKGIFLIIISKNFLKFPNKFVQIMNIRKKGAGEETKQKKHVFKL